MSISFVQTNRAVRVYKDGSGDDSSEFLDIVKGFFEDVITATDYQYDTKDNQSNGTDTIKIIENPSGGYLGVYHFLITDGIFEVRLAHSTDLLNWTFIRTIERYASQPTMAKAPNGAYLIAFEKEVSRSSYLKLHYYSNLSALTDPNSSPEFAIDIPRNQSHPHEGTPNFYNITITNSVMNICIGFHYDNGIVDNVAVGWLTIPLDNPGNWLWNATEQTEYNEKLRRNWNVKGNIGDRDYVEIFGRKFTLQEANLLPREEESINRTLYWTSWRIFLYDHFTNNFTMLNIKTHKGSISFGNPTCTVLNSPFGKDAIAVTYFLFSEGAKTGEAEELVYYKEFRAVPDDYSAVQEAISAAGPGDIIYVRSGTYYEHVIINKPVSIIGQDTETTVIDGGKIGKVVEVIADGVSIFGLTIRNGGPDYWREEGGIILDSVRFCKLSNNLVMNNEFGILLKNSSNNVLAGNTVINNTYGIVVGVGAAVIGFSKDNLLIGNTAKYNFIGIELNYNSYNNTLKENVMTANKYNFNVLGERFSDFIQNIDTSNKVENKSILYLIDKENLIISPRDYKDIGYLGLVNCENITVENLFLQGNWEGMLLAYSQSSLIKNVTVANNFDGIRLINSYNNILVSNTILNNSLGIDLQKSDNNTLTGNLIGFESSIAPSDKVGSNYTSNAVAVRVGVAGIWITSSNNNTISGNLVRNSKDIGILLYNSTKNYIVGNVIGNSGTYGLYLSFSNGNNIFHNNLVDNPQQVYSENSTNMWDDDYPSGGNFWNDYNGTDTSSGPYQNETGSDGIGDNKYVIDENNTDRYPLMAAFNDFKATPEYSIQIVSNSTISNFQFNGTAIVFNVTGEDRTWGFCRIRIPTALMNDTYKVFVNGNEINYTLLYSPDSNYSYLYFSYNLSTREVVITPEFPALMLISTLLLVAVITIFLRKLKNWINFLN
jgi:parallel beta-helix repeat protein